MFSFAKCITAQYNWLFGSKDSTCATNGRTIQVMLSVQDFAFAKPSHAHCFWLRPMNNFQMRYSITHTAFDYQRVRLRKSSKHNAADSAQLTNDIYIRTDQKGMMEAQPYSQPRHSTHGQVSTHLDNTNVSRHSRTEKSTWTSMTLGIRVTFWGADNFMLHIGTVAGLARRAIGYRCENSKVAAPIWIL